LISIWIGRFGTEAVPWNGGVNRRVKLRADTISTAKSTEFDDIMAIEKILLNEIELIRFSTTLSLALSMTSMSGQVSGHPADTRRTHGGHGHLTVE
jgi:hypothetical protein